MAGRNIAKSLKQNVFFDCFLHSGCPLRWNGLDRYSIRCRVGVANSDDVLEREQYICMAPKKVLR